MPLYRAYLMENGHVWTAIDLTCVNDDDAKRQAANLSSGHDVELWQGDRKGDTFEIAKEEFGLFGVEFRGGPMDRPSRWNAR